MNFDPHTLTALLILQLLTMAVVLPMLTGLRGSPSMRWAQASLWSQLGSWLLILLTQAQQPAVIASYFFGGLSFVFGLRALQGWLGPRPGMKLAWALMLVEPPLLGFGFEQPALRLGALNLWVAAVQGLMLLGAVWPAPKAQAGTRNWRLVLALPLGLLLAMTLWRAWLGFVAPADYPSLRGAQPFALAYLALGVLATNLATLAYLTAWRGEAEGRLRHQARTDSLTQLSNRRAFEQRGAEMIQVARRHREQLALMLIDIDHFKQVNDVHGHASGDEALSLVSRLLRQVARPGDCVARLGGEEFAVLLARTEGEGVEALDRRLRTALHEVAEKELGFALDFSGGWSLLRGGDRHVDDMLRRADAGLYAAKHAGRGRLCAEPGLYDDPAAT